MIISLLGTVVHGFVVEVLNASSLLLQSFCFAQCPCKQLYSCLCRPCKI